MWLNAHFLSKIGLTLERVMGPVGDQAAMLKVASANVVSSKMPSRLNAHFLSKMSLILKRVIDPVENQAALPEIASANVIPSKMPSTFNLNFHFLNRYFPL